MRKCNHGYTCGPTALTGNGDGGGGPRRDICGRCRCRLHRGSSDHRVPRRGRARREAVLRARRDGADGRPGALPSRRPRGIPLPSGPPAADVDALRTVVTDVPGGVTLAAPAADQGSAVLVVTAEKTLTFGTVDAAAPFTFTSGWRGRGPDTDERTGGPTCRRWCPSPSTAQVHGPRRLVRAVAQGRVVARCRRATACDRSKHYRPPRSCGAAAGRL